MNELFVKFLGELAPALGTLLTALLSWLCVEIAKKIRTSTNNEAVAGILIRISDAVFTVVRDVQQTVINDLKKSASDGKLTEEEIKEIRQNVLQKLKDAVNFDQAAKILGFGKGVEAQAKIESLVMSKVEAEIAVLKATNSPLLPNVK